MGWRSRMVVRWVVGWDGRMDARLPYSLMRLDFPSHSVVLRAFLPTHCPLLCSAFPPIPLCYALHSCGEGGCFVGGGGVLCGGVLCGRKRTLCVGVLYRGRGVFYIEAFCVGGGRILGVFRRTPRSGRPVASSVVK